MSLNFDNKIFPIKANQQPSWQENISKSINPKIFNQQCNENKSFSGLFGDRNRIQFLSNITRLNNRAQCYNNDKLSTIIDKEEKIVQNAGMSKKQKINETSPNCHEFDKMRNIQQKSDENQQKAASSQPQFLYQYQQTIVELYFSSSNQSQVNTDTVKFNHPQQTINLSETNYLNFAKNDISVSQDKQHSQKGQQVGFSALNCAMIQNHTHSYAQYDQQHLYEISQITDQKQNEIQFHQNPSKQPPQQGPPSNLCHCDDLLCFYNRYQRPRPFSQRLSHSDCKYGNQKQQIICTLSSIQVSVSVQEQESIERDENLEQEQNQQNWSWLYKKISKMHISDYINQTKIPIQPRIHKNRIKQDIIETELRISLTDHIEELSDQGSQKEELENILQQIRID